MILMIFVGFVQVVDETQQLDCPSAIFAMEEQHCQVLPHLWLCFLLCFLRQLDCLIMILLIPTLMSCSCLQPSLISIYSHCSFSITLSRLVYTSIKCELLTPEVYYCSFDILFERKLMLKANEYLLSYPTVQMKTCEVITWMSPDSTKLGDSEQMTTSKKLTEGAKTYYVRGLR